MFNKLNQATILMFSITFLLTLNFTILRSVCNTLAISDLGGNASSIPYFELFGVLPGACLMTWLISYLLRTFSMHHVFLIVLTFFIIFFLSFSTMCYPILRTWHEQARNPYIFKFFTMLFYIFGELWKPTVIQMLFFGFINLNISLIHAKKIYPLLMFGASFGSILAGPIIIGCTSSKLWQSIPISSDHWSHSFILMMLIISVVGTVTGILYYRLSSILRISTYNEDVPKENFTSLKESIKACLSSPSLRLIGFIVIADYIAYSLGEVIFLEVLKQKFPAPCDYCSYMGHLSFWSSTLTLINAMVFAPICVKRFHWVTIALILPIALLLIEGTFFIFLRIESISSSWFGLNHSEWITLIVGLGSFQFCACRALKYTFFDTAKELAFTSLPKIEQMHGKLVIDGISSRLGRGGASALNLAFICLSGGILASSFIAGITAFMITLSWTIATFRVSKQVDGQEILHA